METVSVQQTALRFATTVSNDGKVTLPVPLPPGARIVVFVIEEPSQNFDDLVFASQSSLDFWEHPFDDEDWNNA